MEIVLIVVAFVGGLGTFWPPYQNSSRGTRDFTRIQVPEGQAGFALIMSL